MAVTYTTNLGLSQIPNGEQGGAWDTLYRQDMTRLEARLTTQYAGNPHGNVAGYFVGQQCYDTTNDKLYICITATGVAGTSAWELLGASTNNIIGAGTSANELLRLNGSAAIPAVSGANLTSLPNKNLEIFTSSGTWTRPSWFGGTYIWVFVLGAGGGGGSGGSSGSTGSSTSFGSYMSATSGGGGTGAGGGGAGGSGSIDSGTYSQSVAIDGLDSEQISAGDAVVVGRGGAFIDSSCAGSFSGVPRVFPDFLPVTPPKAGVETAGSFYDSLTPEGYGVGGCGNTSAGGGGGVAIGLLDVTSISSASVTIASGGSGGGGGTAGRQGLVVVGY